MSLNLFCIRILFCSNFILFLKSKKIKIKNSGTCVTYLDGYLQLSKFTSISLEKKHLS